MPAYQTSAFQVELPDNFEDASTYAFVFPGGSPDFNRSVVIKKDPSEAMVDLVAYMVTQRGKLRQGADGFEIVGEWQSRQGGYEVVTTVFEWNPNVKRIRQKQWYFHLPGQ